MNETTDILELKFDGNGINPDKVKPHEIAELIISFEKSLLFTIKANHPEIDTDELLFSFNDIDNQSLDIRFVPQRIKEIVISSYTAIALSISTGDFSALNNNTINTLKTFTKFSKKYDCVGYFNHNGETLSTITPTTEINPKKAILIKEETTIFGKLIDVGGENPNVHIKLTDESTLIFNTSEANAKKLAPKIYEKVALKGTIKWNADTLEIEDFKLNDILDYSPGKSLKAIKELRNITSGFWDKFNTNDEINNQLLRD